MTKGNMIIFSIDEFNEYCGKIFNDNAWIECEGYEWFWVFSEDTEDLGESENSDGFDENDIYNKLGQELVDGFIDNIYVDTTNDRVVVSYNENEI